MDWVGFFVYSREEGTDAYNYRGALGTKLARRRTLRQKAVLEDLQNTISEKQMDRFVGKDMVLMVEEAVEEEPLYLTRACIQAPEVDGLVVLRAEGLTPGQVVNARIIKRNGLDLEAVQVEART